MSKNPVHLFLLGFLFLFCLGQATLAVPPQGEPVRADFYRFQLGENQVTVLLDGVSSKKPHTIALQPEKVKQLLQEKNRNDTLASSYNIFLVHTGEKLVMVDAGGGSRLGDNLGHLVESLQLAGYQPEQIDAILITHFHPDHIGGLVKDGAPAFPNAEVYCDTRESSYWLSEEEEQAAPEQLKGRFSLIQSVFAPIQEADKLRSFEAGEELFPGIETLSQSGHTPGHTGYIVRGQETDLLLWGDIVHIQDAQFPEPEIAVKYDSSPDQAVETRKRIFQKVVDREMLVGGAHISFPGLGRMEKVEGGYRWIPVPYGQDY